MLLLTDAVALPMVTLAPAKLVPEMVRAVPGVPLVTDRLLIVGGTVGAALTVKAADALGATPVLTTTPPPVAPAGTLVNICVPLLLLTLADMPPIVTLAPMRLAPLMVTGSPGKPLETERPEMVGGDAAVPAHPAVLMLIDPAPKVTVALEQAAPLTLTVVCA